MLTIDSVRRIGIVGAGTIGASWAAYYLAKGYQVTVTDPDEKRQDKLLEYVEKAWQQLIQIRCASSKAPHSKLNYTSHISSEYESIDFVQECVPENIDLKHAVVSELERHIASDVVIASSTSSLLCSDIQVEGKHPERIIIGHPYNPPHLIPLVEIVGGKQTSKDVIDWAIQFYSFIGKQPVRANKERTGHIANRLTAALYQEAVYLVAENIASVEDVDKAIKYGPGLRWAVMGPHLLYHLAAGDRGYREYLNHLGAAQENRWRDLGSVKLTKEVIDKLVEGVKEEINGKTVAELIEERDSALVEVLKIQQECWRSCSVRGAT